MKGKWEDYSVQRNAFLKVLHQKSIENNIEFLYYYVKDQLEYYSTCFVKDPSKIEINLKVQMTDYGDEFFDCAYSTIAEVVYGQEHLPKNTEMNFEMKGDNLDMSLDGILPDGMVDMNYEQDGEIKTTKGFAHAGSNQNLLQIHWIVDLDLIR